jgi:hypothetical protein
MRATITTLILLLALATAAVPAADAAPSRPAVVLVFMKSAGALDEQVLRSLLVDSVTLEMADRGIEVITGEGFPSSVAQAVSRAAAAEADFVLVGTYALRERQVLLEIQWIDAGESRLAAHASRQGMLDLSFDAVVAEAVREILDSQAERLANLPPRQARPEQPSAAPLSAGAMEERIASLALPDVAPEPEGPGPAGPQPETVPEEASATPPPAEQPQPLPAVDPAPVAQVPVSPAPVVIPTPDLRRIAFMVGTAPFISTFGAAKYFEMGFSATLAGQYRLPLQGGYLGLGGATGVHTFHGKGTYATADFLLVPVGPDVWYGTLTGQLFDFFARLNAGAAVFVAIPAGGNPLAKVVPYVSGGVGMSVSLGKAIAISAEGSYGVFFDSAEAILAYSPGIQVQVRL